MNGFRAGRQIILVYFALVGVRVRIADRNLTSRGWHARVVSLLCSHILPAVAIHDVWVATAATPEVRLGEDRIVAVHSAASL
ncbi:hypothetical protein F558DRAFT_04868 [Streptomyces sp. AmelKG-A3]|nr:hypothetical protein GA0115247_110534 [Streptomyces sp. PalvLS-984]SDD80704.1 hypothetical protein F558DRAFT_04868 [Streptomyces sp. AmelKG-A3]